VIGGVAYLHGHQPTIVHGDLKPVGHIPLCGSSNDVHTREMF
jgi:hypothetical protein